MNRLVHRAVDRVFPFDPSMPDAHARRAELVRETSVMVLYLSVVLLATLGVLPGDYDERTAGADHGGPAIGVLVWGTTVGLALAHWFAFRLATAALGDGTPSRHDVSLGVAQVLGAAFVAVVTTLAIVIAPPGAEVRAAIFVPAAFIGAAGFGVARASGRSIGSSVAVGVLVLVLGLAVAVVKAWLGH
jgi:hypothetical protein